MTDPDDDKDLWPVRLHGPCAAHGCDRPGTHYLDIGLGRAVWLCEQCTELGIEIRPAAIKRQWNLDRHAIMARIGHAIEGMESTDPHGPEHAAFIGQMSKAAQDLREHCLRDPFPTVPHSEEKPRG